MMQNFQRWKAPARRALQGAAGLALLTLSIVNIYPNSALAEGGDGGGGTPTPSISVDALFDFEVPVSVISNGVYQAIQAKGDEDDPEAMMDNLSETISMTYANYSDLASFGDHDYAARIPLLSTTQYTEAVFDLASEDQSSRIGQGSSTPILGTFGLGTLNAMPSSLLGSDSPVSVNLGTIDPIAGASAPSFFVTSLTVEACKAIDGGRLAAAVQGIDADGFLGWLRRGYEPALTTWCNFVNQQWLSNITRGASKVVCILLFWFLAYRFVLGKLFLIIDSALNTVRTSKLGGN